MKVPSRLATIGALAVSALLLAPGCSKKHKELEDLPELPAATMFQNAMDLIAQHKLQSAVKLLQQIDLRYAPDERDDLEPLIKLRTADATYYQDTILDYIDARTIYRDFANLFTDHELAPYAKFQVGMCSLKQASDPSKDQSQTIQAIEDFREVSRLYPNSRYAQAAEGKIRESEAILAEHEYRVGKFYMDRKEFRAATMRFNYLLDRYPDYLQMDKIYVSLAESLLKQDNQVEAEIYLEKLINDYPESRYVGRAQSLAASFDLDLKAAAVGNIP